MGVELGTILGRLEQEKDASIQSALLLSLGEFSESNWSAAERSQVVEYLQHLFQTSNDAGLHGAVEWLLRDWKQQPWLSQVEEKLAADDGIRVRKLESIRKELATGARAAKPQWYVNSQRQTMLIVPAGPIRRGPGAGRIQDQVDHAIAVLAREVTTTEFRRFRPAYTRIEQFSPSDDCPANGISWFDAAAYCNWLSEQDGIPKEEWCYMPNASGQYADGMTVANDAARRAGDECDALRSVVSVHHGPVGALSACSTSAIGAGDTATVGARARSCSPSVAGAATAWASSVGSSHRTNEAAMPIRS